MDQIDSLNPDTILHDLPVQTLPRRVLCYTQVSSTMDIAREHLRQQPPEVFPLLVQADEQLAGRGRMRRPWVGAPGQSLLFSLVLRPHWLQPTADVITLVWLAGVSLCEAIAATSTLQPRLKWPNDVLLPLPDQPDRMGKIAGILLESASSQQQVDWAIIGCGLNVNSSPSPDASMRYPATSLTVAQGAPVARLHLLRAILTRMDSWYTRLQAGEREALFVAWRALLTTLGQQVTIDTGDGTLSGLAEAVESSGALNVRDKTGTLHVVTTGDIGV